jgi:hypothetical protein
MCSRVYSVASKEALSRGVIAGQSSQTRAAYLPTVSGSLDDCVEKDGTFYITNGAT